MDDIKENIEIIEEKNKILTVDDLIEDIRKEEPDYIPDKINVVKLRTFTTAENIIPISFNDINEIDPIPIEYIFYPCLPTQGIAFIYAATGVGKTLFSLNLAYSIAQGGNFLKYIVPKPRKVLYIDGEMAFNQVHSRLMQIKLNHGELDYPENFNLLTPDKIHPFRMPKIDCPHGQQTYDDIFDKYNYELIVIDNLSMLSTFDENKSNEWILIQDWLLKHRSKGRSFIIVHHAGKEKMGYRGTSRMLDCVDTAISLQHIKNDGLEEENISIKKFKVVYEKARLFGDKDILPFEVQLENNKWSYQSMDKTNLEKVVEMVKSKMSQRDIAKELLLPQTTVFRLTKKAKEIGMLPYC